MFNAGVNSNQAGEDIATKRAWNIEYVDALLDMGSETANGGGGGHMDFLLLANVWSLINFEAMEDGILEKCVDNGVSVIVGGPYSTGILATGAVRRYLKGALCNESQVLNVS